MLCQFDEYYYYSITIVLLETLCNLWYSMVHTLQHCRSSTAIYLVLLCFKIFVRKTVFHNQTAHKLINEYLQVRYKVPTIYFKRLNFLQSIRRIFMSVDILFFFFHKFVLFKLVEHKMAAKFPMIYLQYSLNVVKTLRLYIFKAKIRKFLRLFYTIGKFYLFYK